MRALMAVLLVVAPACVLPACAGSPSPSAPSTTAAAVTSTPAHTSNAVLAISGYAVTTWADEQGGLYFNQRFTLVETGRKSGATIQKISSSVDGRVTDDTGASCWVQPIRVAPGAILDTFDAGWESLSYCAPFATGRTVPAHVSIVVSFTDDDGQEDTVQATTIVSR